MATFSLTEKDGKIFVRETNERVESQFGPFESEIKAMDFVRRRQDQILERLIMK